MRISGKVKCKNTYQPITLKLKFDTEAELNEFYALFNYTPVVMCVPNIDANGIRQELRDLNDGPVSYDRAFDKIKRYLERSCG